MVKKTKVVQNLILHLLGSSKYFSIVKYFFYSNFNILKAFFSKRTTSLSQRTMRSVWHWFRAQFATDLMSCQIFYYFLCLRTVCTGCPKKMWFKLIFEFLTLGRVFLGVKNNSKNFGNKKIKCCIAKFSVN